MAYYALIDSLPKAKINLDSHNLEIYSNTKVYYTSCTRETLGLQAGAEGRPTPSDKYFKKLDKYILKIKTNTFQAKFIHQQNYTRETLGQQADAEGRPTATDNLFFKFDKYISKSGQIHFKT